MRLPFIVSLMFLTSFAVADNTKVRCVAKVTVEGFEVVENSNVIKVDKYNIEAIAVGYWQNSCELDFPFFMANGIVSQKNSVMSSLKGTSNIYVVGKYLRNSSDSKFVFYTNKNQFPLLEKVIWR